MNRPAALVAAWDGDGVDPWLPERLAGEVEVQRGERKLYESWLSAVAAWLTTVRRAVLRPFRRDGGRPDPVAVRAFGRDWSRRIAKIVDGPVKEIMGYGYEKVLGPGFRWDTRPAAVKHLAEVHNRMVRTPDEVFSLIAAEMARSAALGETPAEMADRVDHILNTEADVENWEGRARTVARTETAGALNGSRMDAYHATAKQLGGDWDTVWLSTMDLRTRPSHREADQQRVPLGQPFMVGGFPLRYPADPTGPAHESINCRCHFVLVRPNETVEMSDRQMRQAVTAAEGFDPHQPRDDDGRWTDGVPGAAAGGPKDALRVAARFALRDGERFAGSGSAKDGEGMMVLAAAVDTPSGRQVHIGVPIHEDDKSNWRGGHAPAQVAEADDDEEYTVDTGSDVTAVLSADDAARLPGMVDDVIARAAEADRRYRPVAKELDRLYDERTRLESKRFVRSTDAERKMSLDADERRHEKYQPVRREHMQAAVDLLGPAERARYDGLQRQIDAAGVDRFEPGREEQAAAVSGLSVGEYRELVELTKIHWRDRNRAERDRYDELVGRDKPLLVEQAAIVGGLTVDEYRELTALDKVGPPVQATRYSPAAGRTPAQQARYEELLDAPGGTTAATSALTRKLRGEYESYQGAHHTDKIEWVADREMLADLEARARPLDPADEAKLRQVVADHDRLEADIGALAGDVSASAEVPALNGGSLVIQAVQDEEGGVDYRVARKPADADEDWSPSDSGDPFAPTAAGLRKVGKLVGELSGGGAGLTGAARSDVGPDRWPAGTPGGKGGEFRPKGGVSVPGMAEGLKDAPRVAAKKKAREILANVGDEDAALDDVRAVMDGTYAGFDVRVQRGEVTPDGIDVWAHIFAGGKRVGEVHRVVAEDDEGNLFAEHAYLELDKAAAVRGQGFATAFNAHLEEWYRESGVERIELNADIDVGGYAWARAGYDFRDGRVPDDIIDRLVRAASGDERRPPYSVRWRELTLEDLRRQGHDEDEIDELGPQYGYYVVDEATGSSVAGPFEDEREAEDEMAYLEVDDVPDEVEDPAVASVLERIDAGESVSAYEISQVGRQPGMGRDDEWPGKTALLGSDWDGVKWLEPA